MAPRGAPSISTTSSSLYTEDVPPSVAASIDVVSLDDPSKMSPPAIRAELRYYGLPVPPLSDKRELERVLREARLHHSGSGNNKPRSPGEAQPPATRGRSPGEGLGEHQQRQYDLRASAGKTSPGNPTLEQAAAIVPGMRVKTPPNSHEQLMASHGAGKFSSGSANTPTHIPLIDGNKVPPQILNIIRASADPSMRAINLDHTPLGDGEAKKLADALGNNRTVEFLSLKDCHIGDAGVQRLGDMLGKNTKLTELHLDRNRVGAEGAAALSTALITNETLAVLTLNDNDALGDRGVSYLIGAMEHNTTLRTLAVHNCGAGRSRLSKLDDLLADRQVDANFESLLERLRDDDFWVTGIDLSGRRIGDKGAVRLAEALADNTQVRQLWLRGCNVGDEGARALASCLEQNMSIVDLFLGNNAVGNDGVIAISDALALSNLTLVSLELDDNNIGERGIDAFARALEKNTSLLVASFENNPLGGDRTLQQIEKTLAEKRDGLNLVSFVVDPDAGGSTVGGDEDKSGIVNMSVCSSYMPSTYRRAGFTSVAGPTKLGDDHLRHSGESHRHSVYHRDNAPQSRPQDKDSPPASIAFSKSSSKKSSRTSSKSPRRARSGSGGSPKAGPPAPPPPQQPKPAPPPKPQPKARPASPPPFASKYAKSNPYQKAHVPVPLKAQALETIAERSTGASENDSRGIHSGQIGSGTRTSGTKKSSTAFASDLAPLVEGTEGTSLTTPLIGKKGKDAGTLGQTTISESIAHPQTQRNFDTTMKKLWRRVEMMKRTNHFAAKHYRARHFWFWFVPISSCLSLSILLSLACAVDTSGGSRIGLSLAVGFFAFVAFGLNFLQARFGWSSRAENHRAAEVELNQVAFRLDTLGKYEGSGLASGSHSTKSRANAIRDLYRIDVYLQAMQRCTPEAPASINEMFYLMASRLKGICTKYPNAVKLRSAYAFYDDDPDGDNPVPVEMQIDALDLLGREIEGYFLYPLFMPNAKEVVSRTIDIFFAKPEGGTTSAPDHDNDASVGTQSFYSYEEDDDMTEIV